jgi:hypothetical protein
LLHLSVLPLCLVAAIAVVLTRPTAGADKLAPVDADIQKWIAQLGSDNFDVREEATRRLMDRPDAIPALRNARQSPDAEVRRPAAQILDVLDRNEKERDFAQFRKFALDGAIDQAVEKLVRREKWDDATACWQVLAELAGKLTDLEQIAFGKTTLPAPDEVPARDFRKYLAKVHPEITGGGPLEPLQLMRHHFVARGEEMSTDVAKIHSLLASSGRIRGLDTHQAVIFAGDAVELSYRVDDSLIVCDGDSTAGAEARNSLIIARGDVWFRDAVKNCRVITSGHVHHAKGKAVTDTKVQENEPKPLGFVRFFDPVQVGLSVETASGVRIKEAGKAFAGAGLRPDDLVVALNGTDVKDGATFRRLLRGQLATGAELVFKVRRVEAVIRVPPKE